MKFFRATAVEQPKFLRTYKILQDYEIRGINAVCMAAQALQFRLLYRRDTCVTWEDVGLPEQVSMDRYR